MGDKKKRKKRKQRKDRDRDVASTSAPPVEPSSSPRVSLGLLEIGNLTPALVVADRCAKAAGVRIIGIESADGAGQCIKLAGSAAAVELACRTGAEVGLRMGTTAEFAVLAGPRPETLHEADLPPVYNPLLGIHDSRTPREPHMSTSMAIGLLETQGLVAGLHALDEMLKSANVELVGKEKIGAAYVTFIVKGDVAAVQAAINSGVAAVERLGGKLIMSDVIARPHEELSRLLPG